MRPGEGKGREKRERRRASPKEGKTVDSISLPLVLILILAVSVSVALILILLLLAPALHLPRHMHPIIRVRHRVPHDDRRVLVQPVDHPLRDRAPAELDPVQDRHARRARLPLRHRAREREPRRLARAHKVDTCEREGHQFRE